MGGFFIAIFGIVLAIKKRNKQQDGKRYKQKPSEFAKALGNQYVAAFGSQNFSVSEMDSLSEDLIEFAVKAFHEYDRGSWRYLLDIAEATSWIYSGTDILIF